MAKMLGYLHLPPKPHVFISTSAKAAVYPQDQNTHGESILQAYNVNHTEYKYNNEKPVEQISNTFNQKTYDNIDTANINSSLNNIDSSDAPRA